MFGRRSVFTLGAISLSLAGCGGHSALAGLPQAARSLGSSERVLHRSATAANTGTGTQAVAAQTFVDSVGINIHLSYGGTAYDSSHFSQLLPLLKNSGIKHVRDGITYGQPALISEAQQLASSGIRFDYITGPSDSASQVNGFFSSLGPNVADTCEGPNEPDLAGGNWAPQARAEQQQMYGICHPKGYKVIAPAMGAGGSDYQTLGDVSAYADYANMHDYFTWRNPGTPGYGGGGYGSIPYNQSQSAPEAPNDPVLATETGWSDGSGDNSYLPEVIRSRYLPRVYLESFRIGVPRTYTYEFADEGAAPTTQSGLITSSLATKPSYGAVSGMLGVLADSGASFTPGSLNYSIKGADSNIHTVLMQKSNGNFFLALWNESQEYQGDQKTYTVAASQQLSVSLGVVPAGIVAHVLKDDGSYASVSYSPSSTISIPVDGHVTFLEIGFASASSTSGTPTPSPTQVPTVTPTQSPTPVPYHSPTPGPTATSLSSPSPKPTQSGTPLPTPTATSAQTAAPAQHTIGIVQMSGATNGGAGTYALNLPGVLTPGDIVFGGLAASTKSTASTLSYFNVRDAFASNGQISSAFDSHLVNSGDMRFFTANVAGGDWASGIVLEVSGANQASPIASDTSADATSGNVTCPAPNAGTSYPAGSLLTCFIYVNGGTQNPSLSQSPSAPAGWTFDGASNASFNEVYLFHRRALTSAGENLQGITVNLSTMNGMQYLTGTHAQTVLIQAATS